MKPFITPELSVVGQKVLRLQCEGVERGDLRTSIEGSSVVAYAMPKGHTHRATWLFQVILGDGRLLEFSSACTRVVDWQEVGSLNVLIAIQPSEATKGGVTALPIVDVTPFSISALDMLVYEDHDVVSECGLVICGHGDSQIIVAAGIPPGSVSVATLDSTESFEPQFSVSVCTRVRM
jgi:hypothetical protein